VSPAPDVRAAGSPDAPIRAPDAWARESVNGRGMGRPAFGRTRPPRPDGPERPDGLERPEPDAPRADDGPPPRRAAPDDARAPRRAADDAPAPDPGTPPSGLHWTDAEVRRLKVVVADAYKRAREAGSTRQSDWYGAVWKEVKRQLGGERPIREYQQKYKLLIAEKKRARADRESARERDAVEPLRRDDDRRRDPVRAAPRPQLEDLQLEDL